MRSLSLSLFALSLVVLVQSPAVAQIVNVQPLMAGGEEIDGFQGELSASLTLKTGNVDLILTNGSALSYRLGAHKLISSSTAELGIKGEDTFLERMFTHLRHQVDLDWLTWETYGQVATDHFRRLSLRARRHGARFAIVDGPTVAFALAASYMFEREMLNESESTAVRPSTVIGSRST